ncbi:hypothetical protein PI125_g18812 [Phytophthora idaei]|nr:hypothetical protein PI125_g18812 [Phytophthora idaei]
MPVVFTKEEDKEKSLDLSGGLCEGAGGRENTRQDVWLPRIGWESF